MTILVTQYPPEEIVGQAFGDTLLVFHDANRSGKRDLNENFITSGRITEEVRAIGVIGKWDGARIVWPGGAATPTADPRVPVLEAKLAQIKRDLLAMAANV